MKECSVQETAAILQEKQNIVLTAHINPDGDALGSLLSLSQALEKLGKNVTLFIDDEIPRQFQFLPCIEKVIKPQEGSSIETELLVILDASDNERIGQVDKIVKAQKVLSIDHHVSNKCICDFRLLDIQAAATCEIIYELVGELAVLINPELATCLYTGVASDCGFFRYANTTSKTLRIAADLVDSGVQPNEIFDHLESQTVEELQRLPKILDTLEFFWDDKIASLSISYDFYNQNMDSEIYLKYPRYIEGVEVALLFKGIDARTTRVSMRSKKLDVSKVALEFAGGGHMKAAGCTVQHGLEEAKILILGTLTRYMEAQEY